MWGNLIRKMISDKETANKLFTKVKNDFSEMIAGVGKLEESKKEINIYSYLRVIYDDKVLTMHLLEAIVNNAIEDRETLTKLVGSIKSTEENKQLITELMNKIHQREKEMKEFKEKYGQNLEWINKFFEHSSVTSKE